MILKSNNYRDSDYREPEEDNSAIVDAYLEDFEKELRQNRLRESDATYLETKTMGEVYLMEFPDLVPIVEDILYPGTYLFAGPPKIGKSFLMLQLAYHVSTGIPLWGFPVTKGEVLYFALEDTYRRLKSRLYNMFGDQMSENLHFATSAKTIESGFEEQVRNFIAKHPNTRLIIIDVLQKIKEDADTEYNYAKEYQVISKLKKITDGLDLALLIVHHTRKLQSNNIFDRISGTTGIQGAADGAFLMCASEKGKSFATLDITGRDQPVQKLLLSRNKTSLLWELEDVEEDLWEFPKDEFLEKLTTLIAENSYVFEDSATNIVSFLKLDMNASVFSKKLIRKKQVLEENYGISFETVTKHDGRKLRFYRI